MVKKENNANLEIHYMRIEELVPADYNPRGMTEQDRQDIKASLKDFGFVDPVIVNRNPERMNIIVGGHQRCAVAKEELGIEEVPCVWVNLDLEKEKELNVRLNKNTGRWDIDKLQKFFDKEWLKNVGFKEQELAFFQDEFQKKFNKVTNQNCDMPLIPKFSEKYDCVIIISDNTIDTTFLETALKIDKAKSYKNSRTGKAMVIDVEHFKRALGGE